MNTAPPSGRGWRWTWGFLFLFLAHAALVFWFCEKSEVVTIMERPRPLIELPTDQQAIARVIEALGTIDPTLFALPGPHGFSGKAWLNFPPAATTVSNWSAAPDWLPLPVAELGTTLARYAETNRVSIDDLLDDLRATVPLERRIPAESISIGSRFVIEGLGSRRLLNFGQLPSATNIDVLTNTVVEIAVSGDGVVESAMLLGECGLKAMDERGIAVAGRLVFEPLPAARRVREGASPQRARVTFSWHIWPPVFTNDLSLRLP